MSNTTATLDTVADGWTHGAERAVKAGAIAFAVALAAMAAWITLAPLSGAIVASGAVKVDTNRKTVQHRDGGIVREILVREGDRVTQGQPLLVLDDTRIDASFDLTKSQLDAQRVRESRLAAERASSAVWTLPDALKRRQDEPRLAEAIARETALFTSRRAAFDSQSRLVRQQIDEVAREVEARQREHASVTEALAHMEEEVRVNEALLSEQFVNRTRVLALKRAAAEYRMKMDENRAELSKARQRSAELQMRLAGLREAFEQDAGAEAREANAKIVDLEEQLRTTRDASERKVLIAPVAGRVVDLRVSTAGGAIGPRDPVLDIVPDDNPLLVEAKVGVDAIAELHTGLPTDVRLTTYRQWSTPLVGGRVVHVSADALVERETGVAYYVVHVELDRAALEAAGNLSLQPGMAAEVYIRSRERTALDYLMEPLTQAMRRSFREH